MANEEVLQTFPPNPKKSNLLHTMQGHEQLIFHWLYRQRNIQLPRTKVSEGYKGESQAFGSLALKERSMAKNSDTSEKLDFSVHCIRALKLNARSVCPVFHSIIHNLGNY